MFAPDRRNPNAVIPAKAGIHLLFEATAKWVPAFAGTTLYFLAA